MKASIAIATAFVGILVSLAGNGVVVFAPELVFRAPSMTSGLAAPLAAFTLLAVLLLVRPRWLSTQILIFGTSVLGALCLIVTLPAALRIASTDAQSGLLEYSVCLASFPVAVAIVAVAFTARFISSKAPETPR